MKNVITAEKKLVPKTLIMLNGVDISVQKVTGNDTLRHTKFSNNEEEFEKLGE